MNPRVRALGETVLRVKDLERVKRFYTDVIGLDVLREFEGIAFLKVSDGYGGHTQIIGLFHESLPAPLPHDPRESVHLEATSLHHFALEIDKGNFHVELTRLQGLGVTTFEHRWCRWRSLYVHDPEGTSSSSCAMTSRSSSRPTPRCSGPGARVLGLRPPIVGFAARAAASGSDGAELIGEDHTMQRRMVLSLLGLALLGTRSLAEAQQAGKLHRIGFLWDTTQVWPHALEAFRQGPRDLGWIEGRNIVIECRWAEGKYDRLPGLVEELVRLKVDLIVAPTSIYTGAARRVTSTIPLVFASHADPVNSGHVVSRARPGTNATGLTIIMSETMAKSLELLKEALPGLSAVAVIWDPGTPSHTPALRAVEAAGRALALRIQALGVRTVAEFDGAFSAAAREHAGAVLVLSTPLYMGGPSSSPSWGWHASSRRCSGHESTSKPGAS